jgi:hypothetical protein
MLNTMKVSKELVKSPRKGVKIIHRPYDPKRHKKKKLRQTLITEWVDGVRGKH